MAYYTLYRLAEVTFDIHINAKETNLGLKVNRSFQSKKSLLEYPGNDNLIMVEKR